MAENILSDYIYGLSDVICLFHEKFRESHPDLETVDLVMVTEIMSNGEAKKGSYTSMESNQGKMKRDIIDRQRAVEFCEAYVRANKE